MNTRVYIESLQQAFKELADVNRAQAMSKYMLNHFEFFGIMSDDRRACFKAFMEQRTKLSNEQDVIEVAIEMWSQQQREFHYCAIEFLFAHKKLFSASFISTIEKLIIENSWWDTVDTINSKLIKPHFTKYPEQIILYTQRWNESNNMWLQRSSIIFQNKWKEKTNPALLEKYILTHTSSKEFFIRKAIGWALREYSAINPKWVLNFVETHQLSGLSKREAIRNIKL
jgi:3-methyladenine DNA glycosylase AlkD